MLSRIDSLYCLCPCKCTLMISQLHSEHVRLHDQLPAVGAMGCIQENLMPHSSAFLCMQDIRAALATHSVNAAAVPPTDAAATITQGQL